MLCNSEVQLQNNINPVSLSNNLHLISKNTFYFIAYWNISCFSIMLFTEPIHDTIRNIVESWKVMRAFSHKGQSVVALMIPRSMRLPRFLRTVLTHQDNALFRIYDEKDVRKYCRSTELYGQSVNWYHILFYFSGCKDTFWNPVEGIQ